MQIIKFRPGPSNNRLSLHYTLKMKRNDKTWFKSKTENDILAFDLYFFI